MPNPIREARLLNSDRFKEVKLLLLLGDVESMCDPLGADEIPPIFFSVSTSDRNSDVRSRQLDNPAETIDDVRRHKQTGVGGWV